jgi:hypothetical protein
MTGALPPRRTNHHADFSTPPRPFTIEEGYHGRICCDCRLLLRNRRATTAPQVSRGWAVVPGPVC